MKFIKLSNGAINFQLTDFEEKLWEQLAKKNKCSIDEMLSKIWNDICKPNSSIRLPYKIKPIAEYHNYNVYEYSMICFENSIFMTKEKFNEWFDDMSAQYFRHEIKKNN